MHGRKLTGLSLLYYLESVEIHGVIAITFNQRRQMMCVVVRSEKKNSNLFS